MKMGDLYSIKTNKGFGIFQEFVESNYTYHTWFLIYYKQIKELTELEINQALAGDFYYLQLTFYSKKRYMERYNDPNIQKIINMQNILLDDSFCDDDISFIGNFPIPENAVEPRFSRSLEFSYFTGKHYWYINDNINGGLVKDSKTNKPVRYNIVTENIADYPDYFGKPLDELLLRFNMDFRSEDFNDEWVRKRILEPFWEEHPQYRPSKNKVQDILTPLPTINWSTKKNEKDLCNKIEEALNSFTNNIEKKDKIEIKSSLIDLVKKINKINNIKKQIGSLEAEDIYLYIVRVLHAIGLAELIELIDDMREW